MYMRGTRAVQPRCILVGKCWPAAVNRMLCVVHVRFARVQRLTRSRVMSVCLRGVFMYHLCVIRVYVLCMCVNVFILYVDALFLIIFC